MHIHVLYIKLDSVRTVQCACSCMLYVTVQCSACSSGVNFIVLRTIAAVMSVRSYCPHAGWIYTVVVRRGRVQADAWLCCIYHARQIIDLPSPSAIVLAHSNTSKPNILTSDYSLDKNKLLSSMHDRLFL